MATKSRTTSTNGKSTQRQFQTSIDVPAEPRAEMIAILNQQLADTADLTSQLKQAHWNVKGRDFYQLHELFDELAAETIEWQDLIAERATILGGYATGTIRMAAANSRLPEFPADAVEGMDCVRALVERFANYCATTRAGIDRTDELGDPSTADLLTEVSRGADKALWFLEAHLQG